MIACVKSWQVSTIRVCKLSVLVICICDSIIVDKRVCDVFRLHTDDLVMM
jgi:hypothetical protein